MINTIVDIDSIIFEETEISIEFIDSIRIRGIAIPVHVNQINDGYICVDGNKRLTASRILSQQDDRFRRIPVMLMNNFSKSGSAFWGNTQNHH